MKKEYEKPIIEVIDFTLIECIMTGENGTIIPGMSSDEGYEPW